MIYELVRYAYVRLWESLRCKQSVELCLGNAEHCQDTASLCAEAAERCKEAAELCIPLAEVESLLEVGIAVNFAANIAAISHPIRSIFLDRDSFEARLAVKLSGSMAALRSARRKLERNFRLARRLVLVAHVPIRVYTIGAGLALMCLLAHSAIVLKPAPMLDPVSTREILLPWMVFSVPWIAIAYVLFVASIRIWLEFRLRFAADILKDLRDQEDRAWREISRTLDVPESWGDRLARWIRRRLRIQAEPPDRPGGTEDAGQRDDDGDTGGGGI